jgi:methyl-accepting chemotaxis protein
MLSKLKFKWKILLLVGVAVLGMCVLASVAFAQLRASIIDGRRMQLVSAVQTAKFATAAYERRASNGSMSTDEAKKAAMLALEGARFGREGSDYFFLFTLDGVSLMHPIKHEWVGNHMFGKVKDADGVDIIQGFVSVARDSKDGSGFFDTHFPRPGQTVPVPKLQYVMTVPGWNWVVGAGVYTDDVDAEVRSALAKGSAVAIALILIVGGVGFAVARSVLNQIGGDPADALRTMNDVAEGRLGGEIHTSVHASLMEGLATMIAALRETVSQVRSSTDSIATASNQIATGNHDLSARTEQAASNVQETAASMEQLTSTVEQTAASANAANDLVTSASDAAAKGGKVVAQVVVTMNDIERSSSRIAEIIGVIDGIAFQTNILALNAAVEAARAGEQGRGFAVVASEVRSLAQRSAGAAKEIKGLIAASSERVRAGTILVTAAGAAMADIVSRVTLVSSMINEITHASIEQSAGIGQVNLAVAHLDQMTQQNAALVEESAAAAESLREQASRLASVVQIFQLTASVDRC